MNSYAHAQLWIESWNKENKGKQFKYIPGVEAYFHPSLKQWEADKLRAEEALVDKKAAAKLLKEQEKLQTKIIAVVDEADETEDIEMTNALTVENEDESKSTKHFNPVNRRHHLVVLPKKRAGRSRRASCPSRPLPQRKRRVRATVLLHRLWWSCQSYDYFTNSIRADSPTRLPTWPRRVRRV
jgi:TnpA family transposase